MGGSTGPLPRRENFRRVSLSAPGRAEHTRALKKTKAFLVKIFVLFAFARGFCWNSRHWGGSCDPGRGSGRCPKKKPTRNPSRCKRHRVPAPVPGKIPGEEPDLALDSTQCHPARTPRSLPGEPRPLPEHPVKSCEIPPIFRPPRGPVPRLTPRPAPAGNQCGVPNSSGSRFPDAPPGESAGCRYGYPPCGCANLPGYPKPTP